MKYCNKCKTTLSLEDFGYSVKTKDNKRTQCRECCRKQSAKWKVDNKDKHNESNRLYYARNSVSAKAKHKEWKDANKAIVNSHRASYRASKLSATPSWLTDEHKASIDSVYWLAKDLKAISGEEYHVDHIIPLKGNDVCGLHVPWNLQVLSAADNLKKSNRLT